MLRLFSSIRKSLLAENKTVKYAKYAVGEFLLIVAGILVALQIQNWNEGRKLEQERQVLIENLKLDFSETQGFLIEALDLEEEGIEIMRRFLLEVVDEKKAFSTEEIGEMSKRFFRANRFTPRLVTYRQASLSGSIQLLRNNDLGELLHRFESANNRQSNAEDLFRQEFVGGGAMEIRRYLGSLGGFQNVELTRPAIFSYSSMEYRRFFMQKEIYSVYENLYTLRENRRRALAELSRINEEILTALEALE